MRSETVICLFFTVVLGLFCQQKSLAQKYQRIPLIGKASVSVITDTIISKPKSEIEDNRSWFGFQFNGKKAYVDIIALKISEKKELRDFNHNTPSELLIQYAQDYYHTLDSSTCIFKDTLKTGKIQGKYPFVDLIHTNEFFNYYYNYVGYSSIKERLIIANGYLYIFSVHAILAKKTHRDALKSRKNTRCDFKRLTHSFRIPKQ